MLANNLYEIESILAHADDAAEPTLAPVVWVAAISGPSRIEPVFSVKLIFHWYDGLKIWLNYAVVKQR